MRIRLHPLGAAAVVVLTAACSEAPTAAIEADAGPTLVRLQPGDALTGEGQFVVFRPEQYRTFGVRPVDGLRPSSYFTDRPCEDLLVRPTIDDPCYPNPWEPPVEEVTPPPPPPPPPPSVVAIHAQSSVATFNGTVNTGGLLLKQVTLTSTSQSIANISSYTLDATFSNVGAFGGAGCNNVAQAFDGSHNAGTGLGTLTSQRVAQWIGTIKWQVNGTHTFTPVAGAGGGGTFFTVSSYCG